MKKTLHALTKRRLKISDVAIWTPYAVKTNNVIREVHRRRHKFWFVLMFNVPVNNFSVLLGLSHRFLGITSTFRESKCFFAQGHNAAEVGFEPTTSRFGVRLYH